MAPKAPATRPAPEAVPVDALRARLRKRGRELLQLASELPDTLTDDRLLLVDLAIDRVPDTFAQVRAAALMPAPPECVPPDPPDERPLTSGYVQELK